MVLTVWGIPYKCSRSPSTKELLDSLKSLEVKSATLKNRKQTFSGLLLSEVGVEDDLLNVPYVSNEFGPTEEKIGSFARELGIQPETFEKPSARAGRLLYFPSIGFIIPIVDRRSPEFADGMIERLRNVVSFTIASYQPNEKFIDGLIADERVGQMTRYLRFEWETGQKMSFTGNLTDPNLLHEIINALPYGSENHRISAAAFNHFGVSGPTYSSVSHNVPSRRSHRKDRYVIMHVRPLSKKHGTPETLAAFRELLESIIRYGTVQGTQPALEAFSP
jgi:hypothetical protein